MKPKVLIVNRNRSQAEQLQHHLDPLFDVLIGTEPDLTLTLLSGLRPWAIVLSLQQRDRSGWNLARQLRQIPIGRGAFIVVHEDPENPVPSAFADGGHPAYVDAFMPTATLDWEELRTLLTDKAHAMGWELEVDEPQESLIPQPRETGPLTTRSWTDLLTLPVTLHNIKAAVKGTLY